MNRGEDGFAAAAGWNLETIRSATFLVAGAGALGNEVLKNLALLGAKRIILVDFDRVEPHNLSRSVLFREEQAQRQVSKVQAATEGLKVLSPDLQVISLRGDLWTDMGLGLVQAADIALGCLDNRLARLYLNRQCWRAGIPWVDGGILQLGGQVCTYVPEDSCYECQLAENEWNDIRARMGCSDIALRFAQAGRLPTTPIAASVIGAIQVQEALKLLHLPGASRKGGTMFSYEGATLMAASYERRGLKQDCLAHFEKVNAVQSPDLGHFSTLRQLMDFCREKLGINAPVFRPRQEFVEAFGSLHTGRVLHLGLPKHQLRGRVLSLLGIGEKENIAHLREATLLEMGQESAHLELPLWRLGVPFGDIVEIREGMERWFVGLGADLGRIGMSGDCFQIPDPWQDLTDLELLKVLNGA